MLLLLDFCPVFALNKIGHQEKIKKPEKGKKGV
jgi:hypothetical protein